MQNVLYIIYSKLKENVNFNVSDKKNKLEHVKIYTGYKKSHANV